MRASDYKIISMYVVTQQLYTLGCLCFCSYKSPWLNTIQHIPVCLGICILLLTWQVSLDVHNYYHLFAYVPDHCLQQ